MKAEIIEILGSCYCLPQQDKELIKENIRSLDSQLKERNKEIETEIKFLNNLLSFLNGTVKAICKDRIKELSSKTK